MTISSTERDEECFDEPKHSSFDYEVRKTAQEANKELRELFEGSMEDVGSVDMKEAIVEGFVDGIILKPHQVSQYPAIVR